MTNNTQNFKDFTNKFSLTKTLRFELVPELPQEELDKLYNTWKDEKGYKSKDDITRQDKTEWFLYHTGAGAALRERDTERAKAFAVFKKLVTYLHGKYIDAVLSDTGKVSSEIKDGLEKLIKAIHGYQKSGDEDEKKQIIKDKINPLKKQLAEKLSKHLTSKNNSIRITCANADKDINVTYSMLTGGGGDTKDKLVEEFSNYSEKDLRSIFSEILDENDKLIYTNAKGDEVNVFAFFKGWKTYLGSFYGIRKIAYEYKGYDIDTNNDKVVTGLKNQIVTRILDDAAEIFAKNIRTIEAQVKDGESRKALLKAIESDIYPFASSAYKKALSQSGIDRYNELVAKTNTWLNERFGKDAKFLKTLHKQIYGISKSDKEPEFWEITNMAELNALLWREDNVSHRVLERFGKDGFIAYALMRIDPAKNILDDINLSDNDLLDEIKIDVNKLNFFSNEFLGAWNIVRNAVLRFRNLIWDEENKKYKKDLSPEEEKIKEICEHYLVDNEISLYELKQIFSAEVDDPDSEGRKINLTAKDIKDYAQQSVLFNPNNGEDVKNIVDLLSDNADENGLQNFIMLLKHYFDTLVNGRPWLTVVEKKDSNEQEQEEMMKRNAASLQTLKERAEFARDEFNKNGSITNRRAYMRALNALLTRINDFNRAMLLFSRAEFAKNKDSENSAYKTKVMRVAFEYNAVGNNINSVFNAVRNYATKGAVVDDKIKLTFEDSSIAGGWAYLTTDYHVRIAVNKNNEYFLIIVPKQQSVTKKDFFRKSDHWKNIINQINIDKIMVFYQISSKTLLGSSWKGEVSSMSDVPPKYKDCLKKKGVIFTNRIIAQIIRNKLNDIIFPFKDKIFMFLNEIENGVYDFELNKDEILDTFKKMHGYDYEDRQVKKEKKLDDLIITLQKLLPSKLFNKLTAEQWKKYVDVQDKDKNIIKSGVKGTFVLTRMLSELEPYFYVMYFINYIPEQEFNHKANSGCQVFTECSNKIFLKTIKNLEHGIVFKLHSKDFNSHRRDSGQPTKDAQTSYFLSVFQADIPINQLQGKAEIFFREALPENEREKVPKEELKNPKTDKIPYRKKRFTQPKILFHVPVAINNISQNSTDINKQIQNYIADNADGMRVIGIDRGEKHLAYYCVLNSDGSFAVDESGNPICSTLNNIGVDANGNPVPYQKKLDKREKERLKARQVWDKIEQIKDLKKGYISQVVHKLARMAVEHNAIITMEDLNYGFKQGRIRIEKNIYQQLENALLNKLQYFVLEKTQEGVRNALQLMGKMQPQYKWGSQQGIVFYTSASFTSKTCPNCGWRKRGVEFLKTATKLKEYAKEGDNLRIFYEREYDRFKIEYKWVYKQKENNKEKDVKSKDIFGKEYEVIYSDVDRSYWDKKERKAKAIDIDAKIRKSFSDEIDLHNMAPDENLIGYVKHFGHLRYALRDIMDMRFDDPERSEDDTKRDVLQCPRCHFDTRKAKVLTNADAVGAYNIARRGLMMMSKIKESGKSEKIRLKEWDEYTHKQWNGNMWDPESSHL